MSNDVNPEPLADGVRYETEAGTEYLVVGGIPARAPYVYEYDVGAPAPFSPQYEDHPYERELLPRGELEGVVDEAPIVLDHPVADGEYVSVNSPALETRRGWVVTVGEFRNAEIVTDDAGAFVVGEYWLDLSKRDTYPNYDAALERLEAGADDVPTSPRYTVRGLEETAGTTASGEQYDAIQRDLELDHIGLTVSAGAAARCSPEDGVAVGRTTSRPEYE